MSILIFGGITFVLAIGLVVYLKRGMHHPLHNKGWRKQ